MLLKTLSITALSATFLVALPQHDVQAGSTGKILGGVAAGAAAGYIAHKVIKNKKKKKQARHYKNKHHHGHRNTTYSSKKYKSGSVYSQATYDTQTRLNTLGYDAGSPDGISGRKTRQAIREFQIANDHPATGKLSNPQIALLHQQSTNVLAGRAPNTSNQPSGAIGTVATPALIAGVTGGTEATGPGVANAYAAENQGKEAFQTATPTPSDQIATQAATQVEQVAKSQQLAKANPAPALTPSRAVEPYSTDADRPTVLGLSVGDTLSRAQGALERGGFENCDSYDNAVFCERKTNLGSDKIAVAASGKTIHTITRKLIFDTPLEQSTIYKRMPDSYDPLIGTTDKTIASSAACGALIAAKADTFDNLIKQSVDDAPFDASTVGFSHACSYYFSIDMANTPTVNEVELTFFDSKPILANTKGNVRHVGATSPEKEDELKF